MQFSHSLGHLRNTLISQKNGGLTTKIAALVDALGNLVRFVLLPGQRHDITSFDVLMAGITCLAFIGDKAFDAIRLRKYLAGRGTEAVISMRRGTSGHPPHDAEKYKWRHLVARSSNFISRMPTANFLRRRRRMFSTPWKAISGLVNRQVGGGDVYR